MLPYYIELKVQQISSIDHYFMCNQKIKNTPKCEKIPLV